MHWSKTNKAQEVKNKIGLSNRCKNKKDNIYGKVGRVFGHTVSQETRDKIGLANKGKKAWNKGIQDESIRNEKNANWRGDNVSKVGLHQWVNRYKGKPHRCEKCYTTTARKYEWANIDHKYKRVLNDYIRMCTSCHRKYDLSNNNYQLGYLKKFI